MLSRRLACILRLSTASSKRTFPARKPKRLPSSLLHSLSAAWRSPARLPHWHFISAPRRHLLSPERITRWMADFSICTDSLPREIPRIDRPTEVKNAKRDHQQTADASWNRSFSRGTGNDRNSGRCVLRASGRKLGCSHGGSGAPHAVVARRKIRHVHPLWRLQHNRPPRVG